MTTLPPQWLFLRLAPGCSATEWRHFEAWLAAALAQLDWRCHLVLAGGDPEQVLKVAHTAAAHVERHPFVTVRLQPCLDGDADSALLALASRFQDRAYREQSEPGLELLPILTPAAGTSCETLIDRISSLRARLTEPRLVLGKDEAAAAEGPLAAEGLAELRLDVLPVEDRDSDAVLAVIGAGLVLESVVERLAGDAADTLTPCRPHLVADQARGRLFPCIRAFTMGQPAAPLNFDDPCGLPNQAPPAELCPGCYAAQTLIAAPGLAASGRRSEATALALRVAMALTGHDEQRMAAQCAACAAGLAEHAEERAGALLLEGLCWQRAGDLEAAADRLRHGLDTGVAPEERPRILLHLAGVLEQLGRLDELMDADGLYRHLLSRQVVED